MPDHFLTRDLLPFSKILNKPGIPELLVADPQGIGGTINIKQTNAELGGSAAHSIKYPDYYALTFYSCLAVAPAPCCVLDLVVVYVVLSSPSLATLRPFLSLLQLSTIVAHPCFSPGHGGCVCISLSCFLLTAAPWTVVDLTHEGPLQVSDSSCSLARSVVLPPALSGASSASQCLVSAPSL